MNLEEAVAMVRRMAERDKRAAELTRLGKAHEPDWTANRAEALTLVLAELDRLKKIDAAWLGC